MRLAGKSAPSIDLSLPLLNFQVSASSLPHPPQRNIPPMSVVHLALRCRPQAPLCKRPGPVMQLRRQRICLAATGDDIGFALGQIALHLGSEHLCGDEDACACPCSRTWAVAWAEMVACLAAVLTLLHLRDWTLSRRCFHMASSKNTLHYNRYLPV
ncbi:uncharacterized protein B0T15DRAFT_996 [Chaetomium strumarium]|uniref:Uncharacterized protein n=1 Tax=Chaetomium strumarium TaxID=1170767 RepID=A0AAJ0M528_9PEZI|nr:hypothetical protein B0T15DRAFT_996 [Chaetomium strumarium]